MERTAHHPLTALIVEMLGDGYGIWICLNYRVKQRIQRLDTVEVTLHQIFA